MLEKIGLPAKPSLRGNNWVVDSSHCQGCSSQFTFINRKHHCRRCGGLFCNSCSQQRMVLRGQGDSPVRICEPCKKLEEAARFELRHGHRSRAGRGSMKLTSKYEDEVLNQILGNDGKESFSSGRESTIDTVCSIQRATSSASCSNIQEVATQDQGEEILRSLSVGESHVLSEMGSATSEELRQQALDEKKKYKILKGEGKSEEALRAFKRGKELERQAGALEIFLRKSRKKAVSSSNVAEIQNTQDDFKESGRKNKLFPQMGKEKDDLAAELRELGWSDMDLRDPDRKPATMSLEGELSTLLGDISQKTGIDKETHGIDKTQVIAHKKKALVLKREGKLTEAKEELKRAKVLEKQLEEQEFLADAEDSDDELSSLIRSMDIDKQDDLSIGYDPEPAFDFNRLVGIPDDLGVDSNFEVTEEDMDDPEIAAALESLGWTEDSNYPVDIVPQFVPIDKEAVLREIHSLKREALNQKRVGNVAEALAQLKKAKVLERDLGSIDSQGNNSVAHLPAMIRKDSISQTDEKLSESNKVDGGNVNAMKGVDSKLATKSKLMIQKELLGLKKKALALRREGRLDEAEEELKKGKVLEQQLEEMDNASKLKVAQANFNNKDSELAYGHPDISRTLAFEDEGEEGDVTDQDMHDQTYLSLLRNLGWKDEDHESIKFPSKPSKQNDLSVQITDYPVTRAPSSIPVGESRKTKAEIQRELLGLKRKALALRRQGEVEEAEEVLRMAKLLEAQLAEMEAAKKEGPDDFAKHKEDDIIKPPFSSSVAGGDDKDVTERDTSDPTLLSMLKNLGWKDEEVEPVSMQAKPSMRVAGHSLHSTDPSVIESSTGTPVVTKRRSKGEIQRELLGLKRKALALRRQGETEEAEEVLRMADVLAAQMEEVEAPKEELLLDVPKDKVPESCGSSISQEKNGSLKAVKESNQGSVGPNDKVAEGSIGSDTAKPLPRSSDISIPETSQLIEDNSPLIAELGPPAEKRTAESTGFFPPSGQSVNLMDLLTGDDWKSSQIPVEEVEDSRKFSSGISSLGNPPIQLRSLKSPNEELENKDDVEKRKEMVLAATHEANSAQASVSHYNQSSLRQEILAHKRKAVALKREGKLAEAREELRQAKLLEKSLGEDNPHSDTKPSEVSVSTSNVTSVAQKVQDSSNLAPKPMSGRDRFKLQQESLSHKRHALKLRREGRVEEAEAEFELAKALEAQLEELTARDSVNPNKSVNEAELVDDVGVEDLLDPQLLSALKAIGLQDANVVSRDPERPEPVKQSAVKSGNSSHERIQLEERIKVEKVKAVNLKRSGKQAEALDALRRAKQFEKKLNSLASQ